MDFLASEITWPSVYLGSRSDCVPVIMCPLHVLVMPGELLFEWIWCRKMLPSAPDILISYIRPSVTLHCEKIALRGMFFIRQLHDIGFSVFMTLFSIEWNRCVFTSASVTTVPFSQMVPPNGKKVVLHCNCLWYVHKTNPIVFSIISVIRWIEFHLSSSIFGRVNLIGWLFIHYLNGMTKWTSFSNNVAGETKYVSLDHLMVELVVNTTVLVWWRYSNYLWSRTILSIGRNLLTDCSWICTCFAVEK